MDSAAFNFLSAATAAPHPDELDLRCFYPQLGCTVPIALNFDSSASQLQVRRMVFVGASALLSLEVLRA